MKETVKLSDGRIVYKEAYIVAKTKDLIDFGYTTLTKEEVSEQLEKVLNQEELSVIGHFIKDDIDI
jgi:hypothetical protein